MSEYEEDDTDMTHEEFKELWAKGVPADSWERMRGGYALQWEAGEHQPDGRRSGGNEHEINLFVPGSRLMWSSDGHPCVDTPMGLVRMEPGDWVVKSDDGEFFVFSEEEPI